MTDLDIDISTPPPAYNTLPKPKPARTSDRVCRSYRHASNQPGRSANTATTGAGGGAIERKARNRSQCAWCCCTFLLFIGILIGIGIALAAFSLEPGSPVPTGAIVWFAVGGTILVAIIISSLFLCSAMEFTEDLEKGSNNTSNPRSTTTSTSSSSSNGVVMMLTAVCMANSAACSANMSGCC